MPLLDDIMDIISHPAVLPMVQRAVVGDPREDLERRLQAAEQRLDELQRRYSRRKKRREAAGVDGLSEMRDQVVAIGSRLDEALRFAREGGVNHPEAKQRLDDARMLVLELERYTLLPERARTPEERKVAAALATKVRKLRQKLLNRVWSAEDVDEAAALAGDLATALQTAIMTGQVRMEAEAEAALSNMADDGGYGRGGLSRGCIPCALGHLGMAAGSLVRAAQADATEQAKRLAVTQKELDALLAYDWVPEKIRQNTPEEQQVIEAYRPKVESLRQAVAEARTPDDVRRLAEEATRLWTEFKADVERLPAPMAYARPVRGRHVVDAVREADAYVDRAYRDRGFITARAPSREELQAEAERTNYGVLMDRIVEATKRELGVQWLTHPLSGEDAVYIPVTNTVIRTAEAKEPENYHLQTTIHEAAHALLQNTRCFPAGVYSERARRIGETEADLVTIAAMSELGLPLDYGDGSREAAGDYTIDWQAVEQHFGPQVARRVKWATDWIVTAAQNGQPTGTCPPPPPIPPTPTVAPGVRRPVGTGLEIGHTSLARSSGESDAGTLPPKFALWEYVDGRIRELQDAAQKMRPDARVLERRLAEIERLAARSGIEVDGIENVRDMLDQYRSISRSDYDDPEDYREDKRAAWQEVLDAVDALQAMEP